MTLSGRLGDSIRADRSLRTAVRTAVHQELGEFCATTVLGSLDTTVGISLWDNDSFILHACWTLKQALVPWRH